MRQDRYILIYGLSELRCDNLEQLKKAEIIPTSLWEKRSMAELHRAVDVVDLTKRFGELLAVDRVSFEVEKGEIFGFLGPNGAGKTTTIRMLTGIMEPDAGSVHIEGIDLIKHPLEAKMKMGCIPEVGNVYQDLSARENIDLVGRFYGLSKRERESRSEELLDALSLSDRGDDFVRTFSKGMRQRVSIACAIIHQPAVLFLDEPTEGLDVHSRRVIIDLVKKMNAQGSTILLTTHNIEEANRLCQRVCIINKGRIVAIEAPEKLRHAYESIQTVEVAFDGNVDASWFAFEHVSNIEACGDKWRFCTDNPDEAIKGIVKVANEKKAKIVSVATMGPSLEDIFVKLTEGGI
jgi:ABC-2 type transport system ATP-binding protein